LERNTIIVFSADNGPEPSFDHARTLDQRGMKWSLYEGGIREPFLVRWPGHIPAGKTNDATIVSSTDYFPTITKLAGIPAPAGVRFDGLDQSEAWLGGTLRRDAPLFWEYGRKPKGYRYPKAGDKSPNVAVRDGDWKLLLNADGTGIELYNLKSDPKEADNLAAREEATVNRLRQLALEWRNSLP
jgi:arylsulfatase A-like enzyme